MDPSRLDAPSIAPSVPAPPHPLAREVTVALTGAVFPLRRGQVILIARENEAPRMLITLLGGLPDRSFHSVEEVVELAESSPGRRLSLPE